GVQADAAVARAQTNACGLVGPVNEIARPLQVEGVLAERVIRTWSDDRLQVITVLVMLLAHRLRHAPGRVLLAAHDLGHPLRGAPAALADADGVRQHDLPLAVFHRRVIEDAHRGDVDYHTGAGSIRQDELRRYDDLASLTGQPRVDLGIGAEDLLVANIEAPCDVSEGVVLAGGDHLHDANDILAWGEGEALVGDRQRKGRWLLRL